MITLQRKFYKFIWTLFVGSMANCPVLPCQDGTYQLQACNQNQSRICEPCPVNHFCLVDNAYPCRICNIGFFTMVSCEPTRNSFCQRCPTLPENAVYVDNECQWMCTQEFVLVNNQCELIRNATNIKIINVDWSFMPVIIVIGGGICVVVLSVLCNMFCCGLYAYEPM